MLRRSTVTKRTTRPGSSVWKTATSGPQPARILAPFLHHTHPRVCLPIHPALAHHTAIFHHPTLAAIHPIVVAPPMTRTGTLRRTVAGLRQARGRRLPAKPIGQTDLRTATLLRRIAGRRAARVRPVCTGESHHAPPAVPASLPLAPRALRGRRAALRIRRRPRSPRVEPRGGPRASPRRLRVTSRRTTVDDRAPTRRTCDQEHQRNEGSEIEHGCHLLQSVPKRDQRPDHGWCRALKTAQLGGFVLVPTSPTTEQSCHFLGVQVW